MILKRLSVCFCQRKFVAIVTVLAVVLYNEWMSWHFTFTSWKQLSIMVPPHPGPVVTSHHNGISVRVLFVSDPQILSALSEPYYPLSIFAIWDANRFVKTGFAAAIHSAKPDVVVFLGDLLNDGSIADDEDFANMASVFRKIFAMPSHVKLTVFLPGDNDVGGEGKDLLTQHKLVRFRKHFPSPISSSHLFLEFVHVPAISVGSYNSPVTAEPPSPGVWRVLLSHVPLLPGSAHTKTLLAHQPSLVMSGHHHDSFRFVGPRSKGRADRFFPLDEPGSVVNLTLANTKELTELVVPTCSYRMGKEKYGYGLGVFDSRGFVSYSVLWLPSRFKQLRLYMLAVAAVTVLALLPSLCRVVRAALWMLGNNFMLVRSGRIKRQGYVKINQRA